MVTCGTSTTLMIAVDRCESGYEDTDDSSDLSENDTYIGDYGCK